MKDTEFYEHILGLRKPWTVEAVKLDTGSKAVEVKVRYEAGTLWASEAGERLPVYDHVERSWRHLDMCGFEPSGARYPAAGIPQGGAAATANAAGLPGAGALGREGQPFYVAL